MRLIDADDVDNHIVGSVNLSGCPTINAIPIPEDATNGDVIKAMFPNTNIEYWAEYSTYNVEFPNDNDVKHFSYDWWNAKYKGVSE